MAFQKFTGVESKPQVLSPEQHQAAQSTLNSMGKTSARDLTDEERARLRVSLDETLDR
jgi:hypothetical protein